MQGNPSQTAHQGSESRPMAASISQGRHEDSGLFEPFASIDGQIKKSQNCASAPKSTAFENLAAANQLPPAVMGVPAKVNDSDAPRPRPS